MNTVASNTTIHSLEKKEHILHFLDKGIADMEAGRILPLEDAFQKITELRDLKRNAE